MSYNITPIYAIQYHPYPVQPWNKTKRLVVIVSYLWKLTCMILGETMWHSPRGRGHTIKKIWQGPELTPLYSDTTQHTRLIAPVQSRPVVLIRVNGSSESLSQKPTPIDEVVSFKGVAGLLSVTVHTQVQLHPLALKHLSIKRSL